MEEPIANSSMLVLPMRTAPASRSRRVTVDSYGGYQPSRIFDPQVVGVADGGEQVLDRDRHAGQRAERLARRPPAVDVARLRQRVFRRSRAGTP